VVRPNVELSGARTQDALARTQTMHRVPAAGPRWPAVARPVERRVRPHSSPAEDEAERTNLVVKCFGT